MILISTNETDLILQVAPNGRLYQTYLGNKLVNESEFENLSWNIQAGTDGSVSTRGWEVYPCSGAEDYFEPAFAIQHNDGNMTSIFKYVSSESKKLDNNVTETIISLKDDVYPVEAKLHYVTFAKENVIKAWTEIRHMEKKPVTITQYASNMLYFESPRYVLTEFSGDWAKEVQMSSQDLKFGKKIIEELKGMASGMENITWFFGQVLFVGGSGGLLVQSTLAGLGIEVELAQLAAIEIPVCIIATVVAIVFYVIKDRKMIQKYYK